MLASTLYDQPRTEERSTLTLAIIFVQRIGYSQSCSQSSPTQTWHCKHRKKEKAKLNKKLHNIPHLGMKFTSGSALWRGNTHTHTQTKKVLYAVTPITFCNTGFPLSPLLSGKVHEGYSRQCREGRVGCRCWEVSRDIILPVIQVNLGIILLRRNL